MATSTTSNKPTIAAVTEEYGEKYFDAVRRDMGKGTRNAIVEFAELSDTPLYWKVTAYIVISNPNSHNITEEDHDRSMTALCRAQDALKEAIDVYVHDEEDHNGMSTLAQMIEEEWEATGRRQRKTRDQQASAAPASSDNKPTIQDGINKYEFAWKRATRQRPFEEDSVTSRRCEKHMEKLLADPNTPPDYRLRAHLNLSVIETVWVTPEKFLEDARGHLETAAELLKVIKETFVHDPRDAGRIKELETSIAAAEERYKVRYQEVYGVEKD